ncbi:MAG: hypothetical protein JWM27_1269 [Gemmatimonadetes bacterium]|nr:hypothetical protein [Gemmatimonadota bacterium]
MIPRLAPAAGRAAAAALLILLASCDNPFRSDGIYVRLENTSSYELHDVSFRSGDRPVTADVLGPSGRSGYQDVPRTGGEGAVQATIGDQHLAITPVDAVVFQKPLRPGHYTYRVAVDLPSHWIGGEMVRDR